VTGLTVSGSGNFLDNENGYAKKILQLKLKLPGTVNGLLNICFYCFLLLSLDNINLAMWKILNCVDWSEKPKQLLMFIKYLFI